ncbi:MAG: UDP-N-acetylglucosamine 1-carboxyvinyltransferase, partial [Marmoricola sp.]
MESFQVTSAGPHVNPLDGTVHVGGAKNSALKLMAAALLAPGTSTLHNVPDILDVTVMGQLLRRLGCTVDIVHPVGARLSSGTVVIDVPEELAWEAPYELVRRLRASIAVLGPLVARCQRASVALPGGDAIGSRGLDMHMAGLRELGAQVRVEHGQVVAEVPDGLTGSALWLDFPSVGATENLLMAAVLARGTSVLDNAAREPEIVDLCRMLVQMGARIDGIGSSTLTIEGVDRLQPVEHTTVSDRIVAGTWAFAPAIAGGRLTIQGGVAAHLDLVLDKLIDAGAEVSTHEDGFTVEVGKRLRSFD